MRFRKLILENFQTYKYLEYDFENKPLQVQGINLSDDSQESNGAGKTGFLNGIEYAVTGGNSRGERDVNLITFGEKSSKIELFIDCDNRKETLHIEWKINVKGSNKLELNTIKYGEEKQTKREFSSVNDGKKSILSWMDFSKDDLLNYYLISASKFTSFYKSSNADKIALINRFSDASIIDGVENIDFSSLEKKEKNLEKLISEKNGLINYLLSEKEKEESRDLKSEVTQQEISIDEDIHKHNHSINLYNVDKEESKGIIKNLEKRIKENEKYILDKSELEKTISEKSVLESELKSIKKELDEANQIVTDFRNNISKPNFKKDELYEEIKESKFLIESKRTDKKAYEKKRDKLNNLLSSINTKLSGKITCPNCQHEWLLNGKLTLKELNSKKDEVNKMIPQIDLKIASYDSAFNTLEDDIKTFNEELLNIVKQEEKQNKEKNILIELANKVVSKINFTKSEIAKKDKNILFINKQFNNAESGINSFKKAISEEQNEILKFDKEINNLKNKIKESEFQKSNLKSDEKSQLKKIADFETQIAINEEEKSIWQSDFEKIVLEIANKKEWVFNFKSFKAFLAKQSLKVLEYHNNRFLKDMGSDLVVKIEGFKTLTNGDLREDITTKIIRKTERNFNSFSGGERGRLLFASILTNRFMINSTHKYGGLDFLSIDEVFEGVDALGISQIVNSAKSLNITVLIISHVVNQNADEDTLYIIKENDYSKISKKS